MHCAAPRVVYITVQGPKLHMDVSGQKLPACAAPIEVSTSQGAELLMDVSTQERPVLLLEVSTPQRRRLSCSLTCLENSSLCCSCTYLYTTDACAALGIVYTLSLSFTWTCLHYRVVCCTHGWVSSIQGPKLNLHVLLLDLSTETCAALRGVYTQGPELHLVLDVSTLQGP